MNKEEIILNRINRDDIEEIERLNAGVFDVRDIHRGVLAHPLSNPIQKMCALYQLVDLNVQRFFWKLSKSRGFEFLSFLSVGIIVLATFIWMVN
jgi:hypothetical protein